MLRASETTGQAGGTTTVIFDRLRALPAQRIAPSRGDPQRRLFLNLFLQLEEAVIPGPQFHVESGTGHLISVPLIADSRDGVLQTPFCAGGILPGYVDPALSVAVTQIDHDQVSM